MKIVTFGLCFFLIFAHTNALQALDCCNPYGNKREQSSHMDVNVYLQTLQGKGIGYPSGYSTAAAQLFPNVQPMAKCLYFIDARAHYFNDNKWAANLGFATRYYSQKRDVVFGFNAFYDFRQIWDEYHQVGLGFEMLGRCFDFRINGYLPIAHTKIFGRDHVFKYPGNYFASCQGVRRALAGADAELYTSCWQWNCYCGRSTGNIDPYLGLGPYFYLQNNHTKDPIWGAKARIGMIVADRFTFEARGSYDKVYGAIVQGFFSFSFSLGPEPIPYTAGCCSDPFIDAALHEPIYRQEIIVDRRRCNKWKTNY